VFSQSVYTKQNAWFAFNGQYTASKFRLVLDGGNRSFDHFYNKNRTTLIRFSSAYKLIDGLFLGLGFASFYHFSYPTNDANIQNELRPFLQANYFKNITTGSLRFRFRNEFRYWKTSNTLKNRSRLLITYLHNFKDKIKFPVVQYEGFVTPDKSIFHEHRMQLGLQYDFNQHFSVLPYYMVQIQSNNPYLQNIIGLTFQFSRTNGA
jgi:hypothetical protein